MSNWVFNTMLASREVLDELTATGSIEFAQLVPLPACIEQRRLMRWVSENWGTADTLNTQRLSEDAVQFSTPLSPPVPFVRALAKRYRNWIKLTWLDEKEQCQFEHSLVVLPDGSIRGEAREYLYD